MKNKALTRLFLLSVTIMIGIAANAQIISTYAGDSTAGFSGDHGPAISAELNGPFYVVADNKGNIYFSDALNNRIRKVNAAGIITTIAGNGLASYGGDGGPATAAVFNNPQSMGMDGYGNLYIADRGNNLVRMIDTSGIIHRVAGNGLPGYSGDNGAAVSAAINKPIIAVDLSGDIYISDVNNFRIRIVNTSGIISTIAGTGNPGYSVDGVAAISAPIQPQNIAVDASGNVYYNDSISSVYRVIRKIDAVTKTISTFQKIWAEDMIFDGNGNMYFSDYSCYVRKVTPQGFLYNYAGNGHCTYTGDGDSAIYAGLNMPRGITFDTSGNLYIAEYKGSRIRKVPYYVPDEGVNNVLNNAGQVSVYPNPATETFTVELPSANNKAIITVSDMTGRVIETRYTTAGTGLKEKFDVSHYATGIYLVKVSSGDRVYRSKVVVR